MRTTVSGGSRPSRSRRCASVEQRHDLADRQPVAGRQRPEPDEAEEAVAGHAALDEEQANALSAAEKLDLSGVSAIANLAALNLGNPNAGAATQVGADVVIDTGGGNSVTLLGVNLGDLDGSDFIF